MKSLPVEPYATKHKCVVNLQTKNKKRKRCEYVRRWSTRRWDGNGMNRRSGRFSDGLSRWCCRGHTSTRGSWWLELLRHGNLELGRGRSRSRRRRWRGRTGCRSCTAGQLDILRELAKACWHTWRSTAVTGGTIGTTAASTATATCDHRTPFLRRRGR